ncbi:MAG: nuclear transport factor 2 family protein, partial [Actinomadura rubrobrunea]|nr:nuclear transport factor 2 family protein [Actinomadura rubrobrunea]
VEAFLAAARGGDFDALVAVLHPDVVVRVEGGAAGPGVVKEIRGAAEAARQALTYARLAESVHPALVNGAAGLVTTRDDRPFSVLSFTVSDGKIVAMVVLADPERLSTLDLTVLDAS